MATEEKKRVGIWIRVSTEDQARGDSPEHHLKRAQMYAEFKGWEIVETYRLEGVSGKSVVEHFEAKRMMADIRRGHIQGLIFSKLARLARNTRQLLDFSDLFVEYGADLVSLHEQIDTSTPAGRLFYTLIAAMAQWEREEISERVAASVPVRAKLGKSTGGTAPFGYQWVDNELRLNPKEAPVRKLMFELFLKYKKKQVVARHITQAGYRSRRGAEFTPWSIERLLRDPVAKGLRRANYTKSLGKDKSWVPKPQEEWVFVPAPAIVSEEVWNEVNGILDEQKSKNKRAVKSARYLFAGLTFCHCGTKMYANKQLKKYVCKTCRNKIGIEDLEEIFQTQLKAYFVSQDQIEERHNLDLKQIKEKETLLSELRKEIDRIERELETLISLVDRGEIPKEGFGQHYRPKYEQLQELKGYAPELEAEIKYLQVESASIVQTYQDAHNLYELWDGFTFEEKRSIIELYAKGIIIGEGDISIKLAWQMPPPK